MNLIDRYIFFLFLRVFLICCLCLTGIYIMGDFVENLNEFTDLAGQYGGILPLMVKYYAGRIPWFVDGIGRIAVLVSGAFVVTWLQRFQEMTALMAAGISRWRIIKPLVFGAGLISLLSVANREWLLPRYREQLSQGIREWSEKAASTLTPQYDQLTGILIDGEGALPKQRRIELPMFRLPASMSHLGHQLTAQYATRLTATADHPNGYLLVNVRLPAAIDTLEPGLVEGVPVVLTPKAATWLQPGQCFVASNLTFGQLAGGKAWRQFASTADLVAGLHNPSMNFGADVRVNVHMRLLQPVLDMVLFFLGIPVVMARETRNIFVSAGACLLVVAAFFMVTLSAQSLGLNYLLAPAQAAWSPVIILLPWAVARSAPLRR